MANLHVLTADPNGIRVALHVAIPVANNNVGVAYRAALINAGIGGLTTLKSGDGTLGTISAVELATIQSGAVYEAVLTFPANADFHSETGTLQNADLDAWVTAETARALARLQAALLYYGYTR